MEEQVIVETIKRAINMLIDIDKPLLEIDVNERSITHRLGIYLQELFPDWNVDCEYNRLLDSPKQLLFTKQLMEEIGDSTTTDDVQAKTVFPDIIIHHRNSADNLVVIEVKKTTNPESNDRDIKKLKAFKYLLGYRTAIFIRFKTKGDDVGLQDLILV